MVKYTFDHEFTCFLAETNDSNLISELSTQIGQTKWVVGIIRPDTVNNTCLNKVHQWHYETFVSFASITIEECQTTISQIEQDFLTWLYRNSNTCINGTLTNIEESCNTPICSFDIF